MFLYVVGDFTVLEVTKDEICELLCVRVGMVNKYIFHRQDMSSLLGIRFDLRVR